MGTQTMERSLLALALAVEYNYQLQETSEKIPYLVSRWPKEAKNQNQHDFQRKRMRFVYFR